MKITLWYKYNKQTRKFEFNHIENGHSKKSKPNGTENQNKSWNNCEWEKELAFLEDGVVVKNTESKGTMGKENA